MSYGFHRWKTCEGFEPKSVIIVTGIDELWLSFCTILSHWFRVHQTTTHISIGALWWIFKWPFYGLVNIYLYIYNKLPPLRWIVVSYQQFVRRTDLISKKWYSLPIKYDVYFPFPIRNLSAYKTSHMVSRSFQVHVFRVRAIRALGMRFKSLLEILIDI